WLHEVVPASRSGLYFATEMSLVQLINIGLALLLGFILQMGEGLGRFFVVYGLGIGVGLVSIAFIRRIPGGEARPQLSATAGGLAGYRPALADAAFLAYVGRALLGMVAAAASAAASTLYLRDALGLADSRIMYLVSLGSLAVALTVRSWGEYADDRGTVPALIQVLAAHSVAAALWLLLLPGTSWAPWLAVPVVMVSAVFNAAFLMLAARGMLCRVRAEGRVGYTNIWILGTALAMGLAPIAAGRAIDSWQLAGFRACFAASSLVGLVAALLFFGLRAEEGQPPVPRLAEVLRPSQPLRTLGRILWISLGLRGPSRPPHRDGRQGDQDVAS
ncbi:MAG: hypothetical protein AB1634_14830, partial [Thermodesulfobacteriota bacterium]